MMCCVSVCYQCVFARSVFIEGGLVWSCKAQRLLSPENRENGVCRVNWERKEEYAWGG